MSRHALPLDVERTLEEHAFSEVRQEVGGLLVGTLDDDGSTITAALPALTAQAGQTHVTFTHEVWEVALAELDRDHPGKRIVGWYHTHPGFGLFLSEYDRFVHQEFFSDPRMVALVVDPVAGTRGWFQQDGDLRLVQEEPTARPALPSPLASPAPAAPADRWRVPAALAVPALLLVGAIGGYVLGSNGNEAPVAQPTRSSEAPAQVTPPAPSSGPAEPTPPAAPAGNAETDALRAELARVAAAAPTGFQYRVRSGDSLSEVAVSVYGDAQQWRRIAAANPGIDTEQLAVGQVLCVPLLSPDGAEPRSATCP